MKANTKVCVKIDGEWKKGNVVADNNETIRVGVGEPYHLNYSEGDFNRTSVKRFIQIDEEDAEIVHKHQFDNLHDMIFELKNKYFPNKKTEINDMIVNIDNLSVGPCIMEVETIGAIMEIAGWKVEANVYHDYVDGFPDIDVVSLGDHRDFTTAVISFMKNIFEQDMKQYLEKKSEEAFAISVLNNIPF
jgi:hypothetical protein